MTRAQAAKHNQSPHATTPATLWELAAYAKQCQPRCCMLQAISIYRYKSQAK